MSFDLKKIASIVTALGILGGAVAWGLKSVFPTKEEAAAAAVAAISGHDSNVSAHSVLLDLWADKIAEKTAARIRRDNRRSELTPSEKVEVLAYGHKE